MTLIAVTNMNKKLEAANEAQAKLLNGMHEGVLIISKPTQEQPSRFLLCNQPARKLISTFLGSLDPEND